MRKTVLLVLSIMVFICLTSTSAMADTLNRAFGLTTQCVTEDDSLYGISTNVAWPKEEDNNYIEIRHHVVGTGANSGFTNRMMAYEMSFRQAYGAKWMLSNDIYYSTNNSYYIHQGATVKPAARGNSKFSQSYGLTSVRLEGQFRPH